jgi:hypothetical protein
MTTAAEQHWSVIISADRFQAERLYHHDIVKVPAPEGARPGDRVALVAATESPVVFALGEVRFTESDGGADDSGPDDASGSAVIAYTRRFFDEPVVAGAEVARGGRLDVAVFDELIRALPPRRSARTWLVSVDLPIEAETQADAVRQFWSFVRELGPAELPAFVTPSDDELAMQAYVLGEEANLDPEEDDD